MSKNKSNNNGYYELKSDMYTHIRLERRKLDYDMPMHFHRNLEFQYIDQHSNENLTLERLAGQFGYNKFYLSRIFNKTLGASLTDYVNQVRVQKFVKQYRDGWEGNIADLAFSCGFESLPSFYRTFNRVFFMTPKEYFELDKEIFW